MNPDTQIIFDSVKDVHSPFTLIFLAALVGAIVRVLKTKKVGDLLDVLPLVKRLPPESLPWVAVFLGGVLAGLDAKLNAHLPISQAISMGLIGAVLSGGTAIGGHETVAKLLGSLTGGNSNTTAPPPPPKVDPPADPPAASLRSMVGWWGVFTLALVIVLSGCSLFTQGNAKTVKDAVLSTSDIACIEESPLLDVDEVATACHVLKSPLVREILRRLIGQREAAKRAGYTWQPMGVTETVTAKDAGVKDAASHD